ncbi:MAG TPA: RNA-binding protein, partial [Candidatus Saccharicenans sp.]|nr:RNA-binding protein [Candidatus Saccharicenans sp.]
MSAKLYVGNLNYRTTEEKLKELFSQFGEVTSVNILQGRGFGFVEMST